MKKPTEILSAEHQNILKVIDVLIKECDNIKSGKRLDKTFFTQAVDFIRGYADKFHHAKEEDILFVELCQESLQLHCNPVEQMLYEHNLGRDFVKGIQAGLDENNKDKIVENVLDYCNLLQEHIFKEDNVLYPMADNVFDDRIQESILVKFNQVESKKFGERDIENYLQIIKTLQEKAGEQKND